MADTYRIGKDGVKVTFPSSGYTYREGKDGRVIAFPSIILLSRINALQPSTFVFKKYKNLDIVDKPSPDIDLISSDNCPIVIMLSWYLVSV